MPINIVGIITLLVAFLNLVLGFLVLLKNPKRTNNIVYALSVCSIALWVVFTYLYNNPTLLDPTEWLFAVYLSSYGMLLAQMAFAYYFPKKIPSNFLLYAIPIILSFFPSLYVLLIENSVVVSATHLAREYMSIAELGQGYLTYTLPNTLGILLLAVYFLKKSKKFIGYEKAQIQFYILGALAMMVPVVFLDYIIPLLIGDTSFFVYGPLFAIPFSISVAYSILENRFVSIKVILRRVILLLLDLFYLASVLLGFYLSLEYLEKNIVLLVVLFSLIAILLYSLFVKRLYKKILRIVLEETKDKEMALENFVKVSNIELTVDRIFINIRRTIKEIFEIDNVGLIIYDKRSSKVWSFYLKDFKNVVPEKVLEVVRYWKDFSSEKVLVSDEIKREMILDSRKESQKFLGIIDFMDDSNISTILPFNSRTSVNGLILLGYRFDKYPLTIDDIEILNRLERNISLSVGRALLYQEVQDFNKTLQQKVNEQTKELQIKVKELEEARRKERDMIDIMGHELRTPATVVKLNTELLEQKISKGDEELNKYVDRIKRAIENEIQLINTLLSSAKLEGNKVEINSEKVDIKEEIEMSIHGHEREAKDKGVEIISKIGDDLPFVYSDKTRTIEILNNLIGNAIKYTQEGSVTIEASSLEGFVKVRVIDTGSGIPQEEVARLGQKFHRVQNYIEGSNGMEIVRPGGTGLGLYVTFSLVRLMGGDIWVESEVGKGSEFVFTLPVYSGQEESGIKKGSNNMFEKLGLER